MMDSRYHSKTIHTINTLPNLRLNSRRLAPVTKNFIKSFPSGSNNKAAGKSKAEPPKAAIARKIGKDGIMKNTNKSSKQKGIQSHVESRKETDTDSDTEEATSEKNNKAPAKFKEKNLTHRSMFESNTVSTDENIDEVKAIQSTLHADDKIVQDAGGRKASFKISLEFLYDKLMIDGDVAAYGNFVLFCIHLVQTMFLVRDDDSSTEFQDYLITKKMYLNLGTLTYKMNFKLIAALKPKVSLEVKKITKAVQNEIGVSNINLADFRLAKNKPLADYTEIRNVDSSGFELNTVSTNEKHDEVINGTVPAINNIEQPFNKIVQDKVGRSAASTGIYLDSLDDQPMTDGAAAAFESPDTDSGRFGLNTVSTYEQHYEVKTINITVPDAVDRPASTGASLELIDAFDTHRSMFESNTVSTDENIDEVKAIQSTLHADDKIVQDAGGRKASFKISLEFLYDKLMTDGDVAAYGNFVFQMFSPGILQTSFKEKQATSNKTIIINATEISYYISNTSSKRSNTIIIKSKDRGEDRDSITSKESLSRTMIKIPAGTKWKFYSCKANNLSKPISLSYPRDLLLHSDELRECIRAVGEQLRDPLKIYEKGVFPFVLWPSGHQLLQSKIRILSHSDESNYFLSCLHSFLLAENERNMHWPDDAIVRPEPLASAGFRYSGNSTEVYCDQCELYTDTDNWSEDDEDYAISVHRQTNTRCRFLQQYTRERERETTSAERPIYFLLITSRTAGQEKYLEDSYNKNKDMCVRCNK